MKEATVHHTAGSSGAPLKLYLHPLSSYCWKTLLAFYENGTPFEPLIVDLGNADERAALARLWPFAKFPVLRDEARDRTIPESSIIIEYLAQHYPGAAPLLPADAEQERETRLRDRFYDLHVHQHVQKIVGDRLRPEDQHDPLGVEQARAQLRIAYGMIEQDMASRSWAMGESFSMADCAAAPALYYANRVQPFGDTHPHAAAYLDRLMQRPSFARVLREAQPYFAMFPQ
ncbi:MAG: glutathione S-transferase family protein [Nevskia sp.]|nr:glutathione S-transferase family protein [Nevskia sp.]